MWPAMHLCIMHTLYFEIYTTLLEVIQLMSIAGYEAYVCVCFFMYKTVHASFIWLPWDARSCPVCVLIYTARKVYLIQIQKALEQERKNFFFKEQIQEE